MSSLSRVEAKLPPGFRFHPKDEELICDYLMNWVTGGAHPLPLLIQVDLNLCEPWDIPETACVGGKEWYFYSQRDRKYATGLRTNRATISGYWKATGKDRLIIRKRTLVGMRKTLVFYQGRAPKGKKTDWVMHEFRLEGARGPDLKPVKDQDWVLCRVFFKNTISEKSQETAGTLNDMTVANSNSTSSQLPPLMDPYNEYFNNNHEQVPCFSIFSSTTQTAPTFSLFSHLNPPDNDHNKITPEFGGGIMPDISAGLIYNSQLSLIQENIVNPCSSTCHDDQKVITAVLNHLTKIETTGNHHDHQYDQKSCSINGSPSFGEGSSDSYLSEVMWNHYS